MLRKGLAGVAWTILTMLFVLLVGCGLRSDSTVTKSEPVSSRPNRIAQHEPFFQTGFAYSRIGGNYDSEISMLELRKMRAAGGNAVQFMSFAYIRRLDAPEITLEPAHSDQGLRGGISLAKAAGLRVMVKLHMWGPGFSRGKFAADIGMLSPDDWRAFMANYRLYVLRYARLAAESGADIFCIGTELAKASQASVLADDWHHLIQDVRSIYSGPLTYAAHHSEVEGIPFWDSLDYIGIDGYYPLIRLPLALESLERLSLRWDRPVLFTEAGFSSSSYALTEPWRPGPNRAASDSVRLDLQAEGWQTLLAELWRRDFVWGVYAWKWHPNPAWGGPKNADHTPQGKPALKIISRFYRNPPQRPAAPSL